MFDIDEFMNATAYDETAVVRRGTEEFRIRRLNGAERLRYNDLTSRYDRVLYALSRGLLSGASLAPIGEENAARFLERHGGLAEALFCDIFELTSASLAKELEIWSATLKNSDAAQGTGSATPSSCAASADDMASPRR